MIERLKDRILSIGFISFVSIFIVALSSFFFITLFIDEYSRVQKERLDTEFEKHILICAEDLDDVMVSARQNLARLRDYISVLDIVDSNKAIDFLKKVMGENIRFDRDQYNCYFAFEPEPARKYFNKNAFIMTVQKNIRDIKKENYGDPSRSMVELWTDPGYQTDKKEVWYHVARLSKGYEVSPIYFDRTFTKVWMFTLSLGIYDGDRFQGMVGIDIILDEILQEIESVNIGDTGGLLVVNNKTGLVITRNSTPGKSKFLDVKERFKTNLFDNDAMEKIWKPVLIANHDIVSLRGMDGKDGSDYVVSTRKLTQLPWTVVAFQSREESEKTLQKSLRGVGITGAVLLILFIGLSYFISRNLTRPINQLISAMKKVKGDQITGVSAPVGGTTETRIMGEIFNGMIQTIAAAIGEKEVYYSQLEDMNRTLEHKVADRTSEIAGKNAELEEALKTLRETQDQLVVKEKLASLGALTAGIAHEIKNPLNFVNNFAYLSVDLIDELNDILKESLEKLSEEQREEAMEIMETLRQNVAKINEHGKRADSIVKNMLLHSRGKSGDMKLTDLNGLIDEYVNLAYHGQRAVDAGFNITIKTDYDPAVGSLMVVPQDFGRVILNMANNGFYSAFEKKKKSEEPFSPEFSVTTGKLEKGVEIRLRDNGDGIPKEILDKVFNPFFTTKPPGVSTGLGLSISHDIIVQEHHGEIRIETEPGEFTEFIITLRNQ